MVDLSRDEKAYVKVEVDTKDAEAKIKEIEESVARVQKLIETVANQMVKSTWPLMKQVLGTLMLTEGFLLLHEK